MLGLLGKKYFDIYKCLYENIYTLVKMYFQYYFIIFLDSFSLPFHHSSSYAFVLSFLTFVLPPVLLVSPVIFISSPSYLFLPTCTKLKLFH